ncbi:TrbI/VirB10 family protein [Solilutibacter silvestris]|uniref:Bacterial conjugation TrbI-like protein n=1 Tax=Solilutibacter silvestris TaxID=1645665 RepID=A0A2K1PYQ1_9GAMM|nr:TrbI/VirB10 family protein [Lysobacter silvestris]PNS07924.1 Bacterial conjugation TrbI-like protein [Lysobacter silvestris]
MSQHYPPSDDNNHSQQQGGQEPQAQGNPYFDRVQGGTAADLDAAAPTLTQTEMQQLNRKAMFFLAAIVGLLLLVAFWIMHSLSNRDDGKKKAADAQRPTQVVETPDLPRAAPAPPVNNDAAQPIDVVNNAPPLPPAPNHASANRARAGDYGDGGDQSQAMPAGPRPPSLVERRMWNGNMPPPDAAPQAQGQGMAGAQGQQGGMMVMGPNGPMWVPNKEMVKEADSSAKLLSNPDALLVRGTYIRCILETRIITDIPGFTSCIVTEPVYSINGRRLLLPRGSKMLGKYDSAGIARGRVAVIWDRITTPNGYDISMASPGTDQLGGAGHPGQYDAHWPSRVATAMLISMVSDLFKYEGQKHGPSGTVVTPSGVAYESPYESNTARTVQSMAEQAINESANRKPTVTINQGTQLNVYVAQDVDFSNVLARR